MAARSLRLRLKDLGGRLRDAAYSRLAANWRDGVGPDEEAATERAFRGLVEWEAAKGTRLEGVLLRLPPALAQAIRRQLGAILAEADAGPRPRPRGRQPAPGAER